MDLKRRLNTLRGQSGNTPVSGATAQAGRPGSDLMHRLRRMQQACHGPPRHKPLDDDALARHVSGRVVADGLLLIERRLPLPHAGLADLQCCLLGLPEAGRLPAPGWVFIDTETSGLAGGTGTVAFMLGLARMEGVTLTVRQYLLSRFAGERVMFEHALDWLGEDTGLVSYNGKSFDLPLLKTRTRLTGLEPAVWERPHLDLLHAVRRCFELHWPDCRLGTAEARLLGVVRQDDLPGSEAPAAWLTHLHRGDPSRLSGVLDHNRQDLLSLASLLPVLADVQRGESIHQGHIGRIARAWLRQGDAAQARRLLERAPAQLNQRERLLLARLQSRAGDQDAALALLEDLAGEGNSEATELLAKYHEHVSRNLSLAVSYTLALPASMGRERRLNRLGEKQGLNIRFPF